jgi:NitT/TauT family transport system permease protein
MGYLITRSASQFYTAGVFASLIVLTLLGVALTGLVVVLEKYLLAWRTEGAR